MKRSLFIFSLSVLLFASCGPSTYTLYVDMRNPTLSGLDLGGKSMSVVYLENGDSADSLFSAGAADSFASILEKGYFSGETAVEVYKMEPRSDTVFSPKDTLVKLVVETGTDVVFLIDQRPQCDTLSMYVYDSLDPDDMVINFKAGNFRSHDSSYVGRQTAMKFLPTWKTEPFKLYYYENSTWFNAVNCAVDMKWKMALEKWMTCLDTSDLLKRSCAEYNIALACFMLSDYSLALEWLDASDKDNKLELSPALRSKINSYMK